MFSWRPALNFVLDGKTLEEGGDSRGCGMCLTGGLAALLGYG